MSSEDELQRRDLSLVPPEITRLSWKLALPVLNNYRFALLVYHNSILPIHRLPNELLINIFLLVIRSGTSLIKMSHVCYRWRAVALDCPALWTSIHTDNGDCLKAHLRRSHTMAVDITWDLLDVKSSEKMEAFVHILRPHAQRISGLRCSFKRSVMKTLLSCLDFPLPSLETLELATVKDRIRAPLISSDRPIFVEHAASLRFLSLSGIVIPFTSPIYKGLLSLELSYQFHASMNLADLVQTLERSPNIEHLALKSSGPLLPSELDVDMIPAHTVKLNRLCNLTIRKGGEFNSVCRLLECLSMPTSTFIDIKGSLRLDNQPWSAFAVFPPNPTSKIKGLSKIQHLVFKVEDTEEIGTRFEVQGFAQIGSGKLIELDFRTYGDPWTAICLSFQQLGPMFASAPVKKLSIDSWISNCPADWKCLPECFPLLEELEVDLCCDCSDKEIFRVLGCPQSTHSYASVSCPRLRRLELVLSEPPPSVMDALRRCLDYRASHGNKLPLLHVYVDPEVVVDVRKQLCSFPIDSFELDVLKFDD